MRRTSVAVVALATAFAVATYLRAEEQARDRWGRTRPVVVAQRDLQPGESVDSSAVTMRDLPDAVVTDTALSAAPIGSVVRYPVAAGEPLVGERLAPEGVTGLAALVPKGHRAVGLPQGQLGTPPLQVGDLVEVHLVQPPDVSREGSHGYSQESEYLDPQDSPTSGQGASQATDPLVTGARVVDVNDEVVTVVVPAAEAASLAYAAISGVVLLTLTGA